MLGSVKRGRCKILFVSINRDTFLVSTAMEEKPFSLADDIYVYSYTRDELDIIFVKDLMTSRYKQFHVKGLKNIECVFYAIISLLRKNKDVILKELKDTTDILKYFDAFNPRLYKTSLSIVKCKDTQSITINQSTRVELQNKLLFIILRNLENGRNRLLKSGVRLTIDQCITLLPYIARKYNIADSTINYAECSKVW